MVGNWISALGRAGQCPIPSGILYFLPFLADFLGMLLLEKEYWNFSQPLRFKMSDFLIRM